MVNLPDDLLSAILANIPFDKHKVAMQGVDKQWQRVLQSRGAHSSATFEDDEHLPEEFHRVEGDGSSLISPLLVAALAGCKIPFLFQPEDPFQQEFSCALASLPSHLEMLEISPDEGIPEDCPKFLALKRLKLSMSTGTETHAVCGLQEYFPNLEDIVLNCLDMDWIDMETTLYQMGFLQNLARLDIVTYAADAAKVDQSLKAVFFDFNGPLGCSVSYTMVLERAVRSLAKVPDGLAARLREFTGDNSGGTLCGPILDLSVFSKCTQLERLIFWKPPQAKFGVWGLDELPESCQSIFIKSEISEDVDEKYVAPLVQFSRNWHSWPMSSKDIGDFGVHLGRIDWDSEWDSD